MGYSEEVFSLHDVLTRAVYGCALEIPDHAVHTDMIAGHTAHDTAATFKQRVKNHDFDELAPDEDPNHLPMNREPMTDEEFEVAARSACAPYDHHVKACRRARVYAAMLLSVLDDVVTGVDSDVLDGVHKAPGMDLSDEAVAAIAACDKALRESDAWCSFKWPKG